MNRLLASFSAISLACLAMGCEDSSTVDDADATGTGGVGLVGGNATLAGVDAITGGSTAGTMGTTGGISGGMGVIGGTAGVTGAGTGGFGPTTGGFGPTTGGVGPTTGGFGPTTGGFGPTTGGFGPTTGGVGPTTGGGGPAIGGGGPAIGGSGPEAGGGGPETGGGGPETGGGGPETGGGGPETGGGGPEIGGGGPEIGGGGPEIGGGGPETGGGGPETGGATTGGDDDCDGEAPVLDNPAPASDFTEEVGGVSFDMVYIPGGTFTLGCEGGSCDADTSPVSGVTVSGYHIAKNEVSRDVWSAVNGGADGNWYDCMALACELSRQTGRAYRMQTEAEFEYAAKNHLSSLAQIDGSEEWAYNSWSTSHSTELNDPVGAASGEHTQKTRRDKASGDNITGRLIRSIDGIGPKCRLVISNEMEYPPNYVPPCDICPPRMTEEPVNSYRDPRWITGDDAHWVAGAELGFGTMDLRVWEDGTARQGNTDGQWFTSNNIVFVFVPSSGESITYQYIFLDETQGSLLSEQGFFGGFIGRIAKESADSVAKPTISGLQSGAELAAAAGDKYKMVDMENIPESAKGQDPRLLDGVGQGWFQNNINAGGTHNYRKDVDPDEFRFVVIDGGQAIMLANGSWFTVNDTFLRITHPDGYTCDYLYALSSDGGTFYHNSYQGYERADFRMFEIYSNTSGEFPPTCINNSCSNEIPKGEPASFYSTQEVGQSTFVPAPCPAEGCQ